MKKDKHHHKAGEKPEEKKAAPVTEKAVKPEEVDYKDKWMRTLAEYDNLKKRVAKERAELIQFSNKDIISQLLPIIDDFDRAHEAAKQHKHGEVFSKGVEMILNQLHKLLTDNGVEKVRSVGEKFDPHVHEALTTVETEDHPEDTVVEEISPGYTLNGRLLRAAKVKIAQNKK